MDNVPVTGDKLNILLLSFDVELRDRRNGEHLEGAAVEIGDAKYDIEAAIERIEAKYSALGYEILAATLSGQKIYAFNAVELYEQLPEIESDELPAGIGNIKDLLGTQFVKEDYSRWESSGAAVEAALKELEGAEE